MSQLDRIRNKSLRNRFTLRCLGVHQVDRNAGRLLGTRPRDKDSSIGSDEKQRQKVKSVKLVGKHHPASGTGRLAQTKKRKLKCKEDEKEDSSPRASPEHCRFGRMQRPSVLILTFCNDVYAYG